MKRLLVLTASVLVLGGAKISRLQAQPEGLASKITQTRKGNADLMRQYSWESRMELLDKGKVADTRIEFVLYGGFGEVKRTLLNEESSPLPRGFVRRQLAEKEKARVEKYLVGLRQLLEQYTLPARGKALDFPAQAKIQASDENGLVQLTATNVVVPGDAVNLSVLVTTRQPRQMVITTTFEGDPVTATASFRTLPTGLNHLEFGEVDVPARKIKLQLHNYNYIDID